MSENKGGRPKGRKTEQAEVVMVQPSLCPKCGSARREKYNDRTERVIDGERIFWRRTRCLDCGQARIDKERIPLRPGEVPNQVVQP